MSREANEATRTIEEINRLVTGLVETETLGYPAWVGGIVKSRFQADSGHVYFTLEDNTYSIRCMLPRQVRGTLDFPINNNMEIEVFGAVRVYEKRAEVQISVEKALLIEGQQFVPAGDVIERLKNGGLYPPQKQSLPNAIRQIALITSRRSEALHDFESTYREARGTAKIQLIDVLLQGNEAVVQIVNAIERVNHEKQAQVIAIVRGGGRHADLATFNDYRIAEVICRSAIPVVTGIGHQQDETFADIIADHAAITPTAAAIKIAQTSRKLDSPQAVTTSDPRLLFGVIGLMGVVIVILLVVVLGNGG